MWTKIRLLLQEFDLGIHGHTSFKNISADDKGKRLFEGFINSNLLLLLQVLDWSKMKKVDLSRKQELFVDGNPLTYPPVDVCECGLKSMMRYFQETQANVKVYQGVKVCKHFASFILNVIKTDGSLM